MAIPNNILRLPPGQLGTCSHLHQLEEACSDGGE